MTIASYLARRALAAPWQVTPHLPAGIFRGAVVIPARSELAHLPATLASLAANPADTLSRFLVLVVVNNRSDAPHEEKADNRETLRRLPDWKRQLGLSSLFWVDAAGGGQELPAGQGVGLARRIGLDLALRATAASVDPLLICLDADTLVQPDYLAAIERHFNTATAGGAAIPFRHQTADGAAGQEAIDRYELFLRGYVLGLSQAGSPYAFFTVGSAMACRASAYAAAGGMNRRLAGEDFYFLQQLHKVAGVAPLAGTTVYPAPRASQRVPFGTGRAVGDMLVHGRERLMFYRPELFGVLGEWLQAVREEPCAGGERLVARAAAIHPALGGYLRSAGFAGARDRMLRGTKGETHLAAAFHGWFDAFRTMRLMHVLTDAAFSRVPPGEGLLPLLERDGYRGSAAVPEMLEWLRRRESETAPCAEGRQ